MEKIQKVELLAPAGSYEKAVIAFIYGADAVYVGTPNISLRTRAKVDDDELEKIIKYAKAHNKKVYSAINIYADDDQYDEIISQVKYLSKMDIDGIIASDGGVVDVIKEYAPNIPVNISTQANTISGRACSFWEKNGAKRIILGREINIDNLRKIMKNKNKDLEIEVFVHGAICFAYSGRCFLSDYLAKRSANKGDCAQCCRWNYKMYLEDVNRPGELIEVEEDSNGTTLLSSKDLCLIDELEELIEMGVDSFKIEGRLKTEYYLASIINTYRCAIDEILKNKQLKDKTEYTKYLEEIEKVKTRELTKFNFNIKKNWDVDEIQDLNGRQYNNNYQYGALVDSYLEDEKLAKVYIKNKISIGDTLELIVPNTLKPLEFKVTTLKDVETLEDIETINPGKQNQMVILNVPVEVQKYYVIRRKK